MSAFFISSGNIPDSSDLLNIIVKGSIIDGLSFFKRLFEMESWPLLVLLGRDFIRSCIYSGLVGVKNSELLLFPILSR